MSSAPTPRPKRKRHALGEARWPSAEEAAKSRLFSPVDLGPIRAQHRTWVPAMVPWRATEEGFVTPEVLRWYGRFADGRPGVLVVEATGIRDVPSGPLLRIGHDRFLPGLRELVETVRQRSGGETRLLIQIIDFLAIKRRPEKEKYLRRFLALDARHRRGAEERLGRSFADDDELREALVSLPHDDLLDLLSPREREDLEMGYRERVDDMHLEHVRRLPEELPELFAAAAGRAREAGFDGVELHFAHAYTMASFLSRKNQRGDGYGGSPEARVRLPLEVYERVRERVGKKTCVGARFLTDEIIEGGSRVEDAAYYAERFAAAGMDFLSLSRGGKFDDAAQPKVGEAAYPYTGPSGHECMPTVFADGAGPFGRNLEATARVRHAVRAVGHATPVVAAGGFHAFHQAEEALARGACDVVASARQSLADPDWFLKMRLGEGESVRRCVFTNYCEALDQKHVEVTCQLWDREFETPDTTGAPDENRAPGVAGDGPQVRRSRDGKRRLEAPPWAR